MSFWRILIRRKCFPGFSLDPTMETTKYRIEGSRKECQKKDTFSRKFCYDEKKKAFYSNIKIKDINFK